MPEISGHIVNEGRIFYGSVKIDGDRIVEIRELPPLRGGSQSSILNSQCSIPQDSYILPGVIDEHVHFREPGLTEKGDIESESRAAAAGGVTTVLDMPNTVPQTTSIAALTDKLALAKEKCAINYGAFIGATNDNLGELRKVDSALVPGIKLFMGASTGNMLVDGDEALNDIFALAAERGMPIIAHCEDSAMIERNARKLLNNQASNNGIDLHSLIRDEEVCLSSTRKAIALAEKHGTRLMVAHVSTAAELDEIARHADLVKAEGCVAYLTFSNQDYARLGARIKCNPAIKHESNRLALRRGLTNGMVHTIATDHAPHLLSSKEGGVQKAASGMPGVQFSLVMMLQMVDEGMLTMQQVVQLMCHNPSSYFDVKQRGFLRPGYKADLTIVSHLDKAHTISDAEVLSKCGWTPYDGLQTKWQVERTICNGKTVYDRA